MGNRQHARSGPFSYILSHIIYVHYVIFFTCLSWCYRLNQCVYNNNYYMHSQIMWQHLYKGGSSLQGGNLQQLRNLINRRNVGASTGIKGHVNDIEDFLALIIRCHISAVVMHYFSMDKSDDEPHTSVFPPGVADLPVDQKWKLLSFSLHDIVDRYIVPKQYMPGNPNMNESSIPREADGNLHAQQVYQEHDNFEIQSSTTSQVTRRVLQCITQVAQRSMAVLEIMFGHRTFSGQFPVPFGHFVI